jgi:hypothetical protein
MLEKSNLNINKGTDIDNSKVAIFIKFSHKPNKHIIAFKTDFNLQNDKARNEHTIIKVNKLVKNDRQRQPLSHHGLCL